MSKERNKRDQLIIGIDASRNRSGGARVHLSGILNELEPKEFGIKEIHLWSFKELLDKIPARPWLIKHNPPALEGSIFKQVYWQAAVLAQEAQQNRCDVLFATDASTLCHFHPMVVASRDLLSYEPGVMETFGLSRARIRLLAILLVQNLAFRRSEGVIFLTKYAADLVQKSCGPLSNFTFIPHGVSGEFRDIKLKSEWPKGESGEIRCLYVSNVAMYKHQWEVVKAVAQLRSAGYNIHLTLVGGGSGKAQRLLDQVIHRLDPDHSFVTQEGFVPHAELRHYLAHAHIFVFASSCENMPNTLVEAMSAGLPIACSNRGPMPEILGNGGLYFDPLNPGSIAKAIEQIISDKKMREAMAQRAKHLASRYSWKRCAHETFAFLINTCKGSYQ